MKTIYITFINPAQRKISTIEEMKQAGYSVIERTQRFGSIWKDDKLVAVFVTGEKKQAA